MSDLDRLYMDDFDAWCALQIKALEKHKGQLPPDIDAEHIAKELQLMLHRERRMPEAQVIRVIEHLLKLQYATEHEPQGHVWWRAVHGARSALDTFVTPSLRPKLEPELPEFYTGHTSTRNARCMRSVRSLSASPCPRPAPIRSIRSSTRTGG